MTKQSLILLSDDFPVTIALEHMQKMVHDHFIERTWR